MFVLLAVLGCDFVCYSRGERREKFLFETQEGEEFRAIHATTDVQWKINRLWKIKLRNKHPLCGFLFKHTGTNFSNYERVTCFCMGLMTLFFGSALYV